MPRSVKSPVKCVVLTLALDMVVTSEFCKPMAKSRLKAIVSGLFSINPLPQQPIINNIKHSVEAGMI